MRQVNRALAQEQLLQRLEQGEDFEALCQELDLALSRKYLSQLRRRYHAGGACWEALIDHRHGHAYKVTPERQAWLRERKRENPALTQQALAQQFEIEYQVSISQSQVSNILRAEGVAIPGGQHYTVQAERSLPVERAGVFFPSGGGAANESVEHGHAGDFGTAGGVPGT
jgi:hypothetical protein